MEKRLCVLNDAKRCNHCGECDRCDLDPSKICDNCCKCITNEESGYHKVSLMSLNVNAIEYDDMDTQHEEVARAPYCSVYEEEEEERELNFCENNDIDIPLPDEALIDKWERLLAQAEQEDGMLP